MTVVPSLAHNTQRLFAYRTITSEELIFVNSLANDTTTSPSRKTTLTTASEKCRSSQDQLDSLARTKLLPSELQGSQQRNFLNQSDIDCFIRSCIPKISWTQVPTTLCRVLSAEDNSLLREIEIPDNILLWQFEESLYCHHQYLLR